MSMNTFADRVVRVAQNILATGPMGNRVRGDEYREFLRLNLPLPACIQGPPGPKCKVGGDVGGVATSCAVFAGAVWWHAGASYHPGHMRTWGGPMLANWFPLNTSDGCWLTFAQLAATGLMPGDTFFLGSLSAKNGHMGIALEEVSPGKWRTAEGGGAFADPLYKGTRCRISPPGHERMFDPKRSTAFDPNVGRRLTGVFRAALFDAPERDTIPAPCHGFVDAEAPTIPARPRTLKLTTPWMVGADVGRWQRVIGADDDNKFGPETDRLTRNWQRAHGLKDDGEVGPKTRAKAGL